MKQNKTDNIHDFKLETFGGPAVLRVKLSSLQLHFPLFLAGINHGTKIDTAKKAISLTHFVTETRNEIHIICNGKAAYFPSAGNVAMMIPENHEQAGIELDETKAPKPTNPAPQPRIKAQVSAPNGLKI